jgi:hypothetical protein
LKTVFTRALSDTSQMSAVTGTKNRPAQKTLEVSSMYDMPAMLAAKGRLGQKWLKIFTIHVKVSKNDAERQITCRRPGRRTT